MKVPIKLFLAGFALFALSLTLHAEIFVLSSTPSVGRGPYSIAAADVNGDGKIDLITANATDNNITIFTNNGSGIFVSNVSYAASGAGFVTSADVNGDKMMDLVVAAPSPAVTVFTNNGSGKFTISCILSGAGSSALAADINGDGKLDLICFGSATGPRIFTNADNGLFVTAPKPPESSGYFGKAAADVNGDGKMDLIFAHPGYMRILTNDGTGIFTLSTTNVLTTHWPGGITTADRNGDGKPDVIIPDYNSGSGNTLEVFTNDGYGGFGSNATYTVLQGPWYVATADINGDGKADLIIADSIKRLEILTNNGVGGFGSNSTLVVGREPSAVAVADLNGDGRFDLTSANSADNTLSVLTNSLTFLPTLTVKKSSNNVVISWPSEWTDWAGWTLLQNPDLNTTNWTGFTGTIGDDGTIRTVTNSSPSGNLFFRLSHP